MQDILSSFRGRLPAGMQTELRAQRNTSRKVSMLMGDLVGNTRSQSEGVCARVCKNGLYGFASAAELSAEAAERVLKTAAFNGDFLAGAVKGSKTPRPGIPACEINPAVSWNDADQKVYIEYLKALDSYIEKKKGLTSRKLSVISGSRDKQIITSDGANANIAIPRCFVYVVLDSEAADGSPIEVFKPYGGFGGFDANFTDPSLLFTEVDKLYELLMEKRSAVYAEAGEKTVIIGGELGGMLAHEAVGHTVEADLVLGGSVAGPNLGKQVASELINLTDFANTAFGAPAPLPVYADDEGTPAIDCPIIENGILVGFMNNRQTAMQFGQKPCGNARAYAYCDEPLVRMRNTAIHPGKDKLEDMIASVDDGYYLIETNNGQADNTGEFMFGITMGYEIKNGRLARPIFDTTISGVAFEMLKTVDMVSDTVSWSCSGSCGKKQPMPVGLGGPALRCKVMIGGR